MDNRRPPLPYFMAYQLPEEKEYMSYQISQDNINNTEKISDRNYFRQMYPMVVKRYLRVITDVLDRMDITESYIYDEYPDKIRIERLTEIILRLIPMEKNMNRETQRNLIRILLIDEVIERRKLDGRNR